MNRTEYLDDYGTQVDPLFDMVDELEAKVQGLLEDKAVSVDAMQWSVKRIKELEEQVDELIFDRDGRDFPQGALK